MGTGYDAIVVGARCGGSPTAMLLARNGHRVLLVDKADFPSDTMSTHLIHPPGVAALNRWGLLERLEATGCPPIRNYSYDFGPIRISGSPASAEEGISDAFCPRRTVLDKLLVDAAVEAGAELREKFTVDEVVFEDGKATGIRGHSKGGDPVTELGRIVIGADGKHSQVAKAVQPDEYNQKPTLEASYYAYWSGLATEGVEFWIRSENGRGWGVLPTHDDLTVVVMGWPRAQFDANRKDVEGNYMRSLELAPEFAERMRDAKRETRFVGTGDLPNFFRKPHGPGWALVGDAGYHKDPITAWGISDAFRDAELLSGALDDAFSGSREYDEAMTDYQQSRDQDALAMFELTCDFARIEPPAPELQQLMGAVATSEEAMRGFVSVMAGTLPAPEFFAPENVGRIMAQAGSAASS
ncbi:MAG: NAD(P)/FAD-dependent oxidoreductase [Thermoleophilaceae bacterium]